jgi:hypothetical protein
MRETEREGLGDGLIRVGDGWQYTECLANMSAPILLTRTRVLASCSFKTFSNPNIFYPY